MESQNPPFRYGFTRSPYKYRIDVKYIHINIKCGNITYIYTTLLKENNYSTIVRGYTQQYVIIEERDRLPRAN